MSTLEIDLGKQGRESHEIKRDVTLIGRNAFCDVVLDSHSASRQHARIVHREDGDYLEDLNSINGTFLNRKRVERPTLLRDGDEIHFYRVRAYFRANGTVPESDATETFVARMDNPKTPAMPFRIGDTFTEPPRPEIEHATKKLRALLGVLQSVGTCLDVDSVLVRILDGLFSVFPQARRGNIWLIDEADQQPVLRAMKQLGSQTVISDSLGPVSLDVVSEVLANSRGVLRVEEMEDTDSIFDLSLRSLICVPLLNRDQQPVGVVYIDSDEQDQRFSEEDLEILVGVSAVAAQSIQFAREHESLLSRAVELATEKERRLIVERQLREAEAVQRMLYPANNPTCPGFDLAGLTIPADRMCGDYFDFLRFADGSLGIVVGDVSGHGLGPAMHMVATRSCLNTLAHDVCDLSLILDRTNQLLWESTEDGHFVTMFLGQLNHELSRFSYLGAGHEALHMTSSGDCTKLEPAGMPLGLLLEASWSPVSQIGLQSGDVVLVATDGFHEAMTLTKQCYGIDRLRACLRESRHLSAQEILERLCDSVRQFIGGAHNADDMTAIVIKAL